MSNAGRGKVRCGGSLAGPEGNCSGCHSSVKNMAGEGRALLESCLQCVASMWAQPWFEQNNLAGLESNWLKKHWA